MAWNRYDFMNRPELRKEIIQRKIKVYLNANSLQMRQALIEDDLQKGINPRLPHIPDSYKISLPSHNNSSP
jgi:hypothetical protein